MIEIRDLTPEHVGHWVEYTPTKGRTEQGRIKSWNDVFVFVVYHVSNNEWWRFREYTGAATDPKDLTFLTEQKEKGPEGPSPASGRAT